MASNFNDTTPAAVAGGVNVKWQTDGAGNDSAYIPSGSFIPASTALPVTKAPTSHEWLASYDSSTGAFTQTQPAYSDLSGTPPGPSVNPQTASYVAVLGDANNVVTMSVTGANTFTIPPNASVAFPVGTTLTVIQIGTGQVTLTAGAGVTLNTASSATTRAQWSIVSVTQISADVWVAGGDLT